MPEALRLLPFLLVPVAALLFLNLRLSRKLRYPHDLLKAEDRRGMASALLRHFRTYHDVLLDALIALVVAFAILPPRRPRPAAVVVDGSRAMLAGYGDERPLEQALKRIQADPALAKAEPFALVFDSQAKATRLVPLQPFLAGNDLETASRRLREELAFFAPDYARLAELRQRGYGEITLLTDQRRFVPEGFRVIELGFAGRFGAYPSGVRYDHGSGTWLVTLVESGPRVPITVAGWNRDEHLFMRLPLGRYVIEEGIAGRTVRFPSPGLYLLSLRGPFGQSDVDLPVLLPARQSTATAAGRFSAAMLSVFPDVETSPNPDTVLVDLGAKAPRGRQRTTTALTARDGAWVVDPAAADGALLAADLQPGADFTWGRSSLKNEDLVLVYEGLLSRRPAPFATEFPAGVEEVVPAGTALVARKGVALMPVVPAASHYFESRPGPAIALPPPASRTWPWGVILALLAMAKVAIWSRLTGKSWLARD